MTPLRLLRLAHGYVKQETFARKCHMAESHLCRLELGQKKPSEGLANTIANVLCEPVEKVFPDGFAERTKHYRGRTDDGAGYTPPAKPRQVVRYPREFTVLCYRCQNHVSMRTDDCHMPEDETPKCPECGARFYSILPLEEVHV